MLVGLARIVVVTAGMIEHEMLLKLRAGGKSEHTFRTLEYVVHTRLLLFWGLWGHSRRC